MLGIQELLIQKDQGTNLTALLQEVTSIWTK